MIVNLDMLRLPCMRDDRPAMPDSERQRITAKVIGIATGKGLTVTPALKAMADYSPDIYARSEGASRRWRSDRRGLMLVGGVGTGKTLAFSVLSSVFGVHLLRAPDLAATFAKDGEAAFWPTVNQYREQPVILDDLGAERDASSFGNASPIADWITKRYAAWQMGGPELHVSTNGTEADLAGRYGVRVLDRLREACRIIPLRGASLRGCQP